MVLPNLLDSRSTANYGSAKHSLTLVVGAIDRLFVVVLTMFRELSAHVRRYAPALFLACLGLSLASAQYYGGGYPYSRPAPKPSRQLPAPARNVGGFQGNPYRNSSIPPTGLPIGTTHNYFNTGSRASMAHKPVRKPYSNVNIPGPLITSRQAAQIEVARGLWQGGY